MYHICLASRHCRHGKRRAPETPILRNLSKGREAGCKDSPKLPDSCGMAIKVTFKKLPMLQSSHPAAKPSLCLCRGSACHISGHAFEETRGTWQVNSFVKSSGILFTIIKGGSRKQRTKGLVWLLKWTLRWKWFSSELRFLPTSSLMSKMAISCIWKCRLPSANAGRRDLQRFTGATE